LRDESAFVLLPEVSLALLVAEEPKGDTQVRVRVDATPGRRYAQAVGRGSRSTKRRRNERQRKKKERDKRRVADLSAGRARR